MIPARAEAVRNISSAADVKNNWESAFYNVGSETKDSLAESGFFKFWIFRGLSLFV